MANVCVYDSSPQNVLTREVFLDSHELRDVKAQSSTSLGLSPVLQYYSNIVVCTGIKWIYPVKIKQAHEPRHVISNNVVF